MAVEEPPLDKRIGATVERDPKHLCLLKPVDMGCIIDFPEAHLLSAHDGSGLKELKALLLQRLTQDGGFVKPTPAVVDEPWMDE